MPTGAYIDLKTVAVTTIEMIDGKKKTDLKNSLPRETELIIKANARANAVVTGVVPITKNKVFRKASKNSLSVKSRR
ncbi:MAG: hypothetical protein Kow0029_03890 [Candidatus Rifleibacteriota bacterium]